MASVATHERFFEAVECGDARTIADFLVHDASCPVDVTPIDDYKRRGGYEWLRPFDQYTRFDTPYSLISVSIARNHLDVLEWLFSAEACAWVIAPLTAGM